MAWRSLSLPELSEALPRRASGALVLFAGTGGPAKAVAAQQLAKALRLDLLRIDLSQVVSKYIGETEKNLERVLASAERLDTLLFFDEADALFGKGTEAEADLLLERLQSSRRIAIFCVQKQTLRPSLSRNFIHTVRFPQIA
jgi:SpoVK/Ycf46/Vps4 family AAA+-type ATPase